MIGREFVQSRLGEGGAGISYAEFSYSLIQGYDFLHLYREKGVTLQVCGADQWGNSLAGVDLIRRVSGGEAHVYSTPLVINQATGMKFGKTEDGAIWLDPELTSVYKFYQFWLNVDDEGVGDYMKVYTLLPKEEHEKIMVEFDADRSSRLAQKTLAYEVTKLVHGEDKAESAKKVSEVLFGGASVDQLGNGEFDLLKTELTTVNSESDGITQLIVRAGLASSTSEANRFITAGSISLNGEKMTPDNIPALREGNNLLKRGKNSFAVVVN
jgi:tyrosyl-tRNA synthetase